MRKLSPEGVSRLASVQPLDVVAVVKFLVKLEARLVKKEVERGLDRREEVACDLGKELVGQVRDGDGICACN